MQQTEFTFPTMEFNGYEKATKVANLTHIFNKDQVNEIESSVGRSIYFTHVVTELIKRRQEDDTLSQILDLNDPAFIKVKRQFENRLNKLFTHHLLGDVLDSQEIDFAVMQVLEEIVKVQRQGVPLSAHSLYARNELMNSNIFKAMFDLNIIWKSKYYDYFHIEHQLYV